ncbi:sugar phosphate isomerase/epimerase family protein [Anaerotalea alkaliphila]|uniref:Sugar phosphate isomerase/epimerase n=1 Tax=Anaerotalea alkaliphila TaxID=2662126 RepID=A0A7X5KN86_9FIRM|nr:sugar phosphate isomerase/epimerase family protein [Anaerotalea alkaliphila]NDL68746.1 sugar phosphate isomerase/epimerase [Anaerotalea alkaliphila]
MKLCYQIATPDVRKSAAVTSYQEELEKTFSTLCDLGYEGVELMSRNPKELDWDRIRSLSRQFNLEIVMICTGEVFGQDGLTLTHPNTEVRELAFKRAKELIDFAAFFSANINIGRFRGQYVEARPDEETYALAVEVIRELARYAESKGVTIVIEPVTMLQTNFINSTSEAIELIEKVDEPAFKLMIDIYHSNIEDKCICESIRESKGHLAHMHFADNNRRIPGTCGLDFKKIVDTLREINYEGPVALEMFQLPDQHTAARKSSEFLKPLIHS